MLTNIDYRQLVKELDYECQYSSKQRLRLSGYYAKSRVIVMFTRQKETAKAYKPLCYRIRKYGSLKP